MTPAEKPSEIDKNCVFVFLAKNASALPTPVASPANKVRPNANSTEFEIILSPGISLPISISKGDVVKRKEYK